MSDQFSNRYAQLIAAKEIEPDPAQALLVRDLANLERTLHERELALQSKWRPLTRLFAKKTKRDKGPALKGLYIYGDVGRGKTMLMDLFFSMSAVGRKRRVHFHEFMADVHERMHIFRQEVKTGLLAEHDPISRVAASIAEEAWLLCFDEFHVTDIADAMILGRLFTKLFEFDVVIVATSNLAPNWLYMDGLNRSLFLPFIVLLERHCKVVHLDARVDFRLEKLTGMQAWYVPPNDASKTALDLAWKHLAGDHAGIPCELMVNGRTIRVPQSAMGVARFNFSELCGQPLAASDYLKIAHKFHTIIVDHIPVMDYTRRNDAKRFIILIDTLYDHAVKLLASAEAEPGELYLATEGFEAREFKRTVSRIIEMRSQAYLGLPHGRRHARSIDTDKIVET